MRVRHPQADDEAREAFKKLRRDDHVVADRPCHWGANRNLVSGRSAHRPAGYAELRLGQTRERAAGAARSTLRLGLSVRPACAQRRAAAGLVLPAANAETMSLHLAAIGNKVAPGGHAVLGTGGAGYHVAAALAIPDNIIVIRLPPDSAILSAT